MVLAVGKSNLVPPTRGLIGLFNTEAAQQRERQLALQQAYTVKRGALTVPHAAMDVSLNELS